MISLVVPVFNEESNVAPLYQRVCTALDRLGHSWEAIFVDDGSTDRTFGLLEQMAIEDPRVVVIQLRRNFGQTAALAAGIAEARGTFVVTMDGDLQNDPEDIGALIEKLEEGYDLANGWRVNRRDPFLSRRLPSKLANWLISRITGVQMHDYGCTLKALRSEIARELRLYGEMHRFIPALVADLGGKYAEIPVRHQARTQGNSKYGISRTVRVLLDLITVKFLSGYSTRPSHLFGLGGLAAFIGGFALTLYLGIQRLFYLVALADRPLLLLGILLMIVGVQFIMLGLFAELLSRTYHESQHKPVYRVRRIVSTAARSDSSKPVGKETDPVALP